MTVEVMSKRIELLSELVPQGKVIALLVNPKNPFAERWIREAQEGVKVKGMQLQILNASSATEIDAGFVALGQSTRSDGQSGRVFRQPARPACGASGTPCRSGDLSEA